MWVEGVGSRLFRFEKGYCGRVFSGSRGIGLLGFGPVLVVGYTSGSKGVGWPCFGLILVLGSHPFDSCFNGTSIIPCSIRLHFNLCCTFDKLHEN